MANDWDGERFARAILERLYRQNIGDRRVRVPLDPTPDQVARDVELIDNAFSKDNG